MRISLGLKPLKAEPEAKGPTAAEKEAADAKEATAATAQAAELADRIKQCV
jgi:hypothetical protein